MDVPRERFWVLSRKGRAILTSILYGSTLAVLALLALGVRPGGSASLFEAALALLGQATMVLLIVQPALSRRERWSACLCSCALLIMMMLPAIRAN